MVALHRTDPRVDHRDRGDPGPGLGGRDVARRRTRSGSGCRSSSPGSPSGASAARSSWVKRHFPVLVGTAAVVLIVFGVVLMFDQLARVTSEMQQALDGTPFEWVVKLG